MRPMIILTDLDGTLLDATTYSFDAAKEALDAIRTRNIPFILSSSKTRAELERIRFRLDHQGPFIAENGGAVFIPKGLFTFPLRDATLRGPYQVIEMGTPYPTLRGELKEIERTLGHPLRGFGDMPAEEIAERTGLPAEEAFLAKQREYNEPFVLEEPAASDPGVFEALQRLAKDRGLRCTTGGRFFHLMGNCDKGRAAEYLIEFYRQQLGPDGERLQTVALGDSLNDLPMLILVDRPILVQRTDGSYHPNVATRTVPRLSRAKGIGPVGWNRAVLELLREA